MFSLKRAVSKLRPRPLTLGLKNHTSRFCAAGAVPLYDILEIPKHGVDTAHVDTVLASFLPIMLEKADNFLGYQVNAELPSIDPIAKVLEIHMNNAGDPFIDSYVKTHCKSIEISVLKYCAELWHDDPRVVNDPNNPENFWGYILNMGSTEGNLNALWNAREYLKANGRPKVFCSKDTHYSVGKAAGVLELDMEQVESDKYGRVKIPKLCEAIENMQETQPGRPVIVVYNMGTTFKGSFDDVELGITKVTKLAKEYNFNYWNHQDGALGGFIIPFLRRGIQDGVIVEPNAADATLPQFGFNILDIQSCNASFYKWYGAPYPTGIFMTQNKYLRAADTPDYIGSPDTTLGGGRNAFSALYMWWRLSLTDYDLEIQSVKKCLESAIYLEGELSKLCDEFTKKGSEKIINVQRAPYSFSVTFNSASSFISNKYSIPQEKEQSDDNTDDPVYRSHIYTMKHVENTLIDEFINDFRLYLEEMKYN